MITDQTNQGDGPAIKRQQRMLVKENRKNRIPPKKQNLPGQNKRFNRKDVCHRRPVYA